MLLAHLDPAVEDPSLMAWYITPEATAAATVLRAGGVPPATDLPVDHAVVLGYSDLFAYIVGAGQDRALLGESLLCMLVVRRDLPERVPPGFLPALAVAAGEDAPRGERAPADEGPTGPPRAQGPAPDGLSVQDACQAGEAMVVAFQRWEHTGAPAVAVRLLRRAAADCPAESPLRGRVLSSLGVALLSDHLDRTDLVPLAESVRAGREAVAAVPDVDGEQARRHANLGKALRFWAETTASVEANREAVAEARAALRIGPPGDPQHALYSVELGMYLAQAAVLFGDLRAAPEAAGLLREAVRTADPADPDGYAERLCHLGLVLIAQARAEDRPALHGEGVALCRQAVAAAPTPAARLQYLCNLSVALLDSPDDDTAATALVLAAAREAADGAPPGSALFADARILLALALNRRYLADGRPEDLAEAIARATESFEATPPGLPTRRLQRGATLANLLGLRAAGGDDPSAEPLALLRSLVDELPDPTPDRALALRHLAEALHGSAPDEALERYRECLELPSPGAEFEAEVRALLGTALARRTGGDSWQQALASLGRSADLLPPGDPRRLEVECRIGALWVRRGEETGDPAACRRGVALLAAVVAADQGCASADRVDHRLLLGDAVLRLSDHSGEQDLVDDAVAPLEQALAMLPPGDPRRLGPAGLLAGALNSTAWARSDTAALDRASALLTEALAVPGGDDAYRAECLASLGRNLRLRYHLTGDPAHLEQAVVRHQEALDLTGPTPDPATLGGLATCLSNLYGLRPDRQLREEAMRCCRTALDRLPKHHPERASLQADLGYLEWSAAGESGSAEQLDAALGTLWAAVDAAPEGHDNRGLALTNLGVALLDRAGRTGDRSWEIQATSVFRTALDHTGPSSAQRPVVLNNLATALIDLAATTNEPALRAQALDLLETASAPGPGMSLARERAALNLAVLRFGQARESGDPAALTEAFRRFEDLADEFRAPHPLRALALARLANAALRLAELPTGRPVRAVRSARSAQWALRQAAAAAREALAVEALSSDPVHALARRTLATVQLRRAADGEQVDLAEAVRLIRRTAEDPAFPPHNRLEAARLWGAIAARTGRYAEALEGFSHAVGLLPVVAPRHLARLDQEDRLSFGQGLASAAAALALRAGDPARALALLEQGRGVLLAQGLDNRGDLSRLRELDPARAAEFERIRDRLSREHPLASSAASDAFFAQGAAGATAGALRDAEERHALSRRWDELLDEIRTLPELDDFLRPPTTEQLLSVAERGPVVVVNVSEFGSHALLLADRTGRGPRIEVLPLPDLTPSEVAVAAQAFTEKWVDLAYGDEGLARARQVMDAHKGFLAWLWEVVAAPVLDRLGLRHTPLDGEEWPRLWWCPTGRLAFLPLHAAGKGQALPGTWVMDRVVSSYTPTVRSLLRSRRRTAAPDTPRRRPAPLVVALAHTPGGPPLPGAGPEADLVAGLFPDGLRLDGEQATVERVRRALYGHAWVHFSCHGVTDPDSPSNSGLILHDGRLSALDLSARRPVDAELAYLSACSTSQGGLDLPDEAVHLAPSFQLAGFRHVIGTLWSVSDRIARHVTGEFYTALSEDAARGLPFDPALALHHAVRPLRERLLPAPHLWAAHVHIGP
ncbi:hypothetical protein AMK19_10360 [Kitasatospora sp. CB01950]|nr:hypothetical protein AMK19_10360 [Kitasatospora sp. CB01950]